MTERESIIRTTFSYSGIFNLREFSNIIRDYSKDKGFDIFEKEHNESVTLEGKYIEIAFEIGRRVTDYAKQVVMLKLQMKNLKEKVVEEDGKKKKYFTGNILIQIEGLLVTDYEKRWETKPAFYVIRILFEKYVYSPHLSKYKNELTESVNYLKDNLSAYLNMTTV